MLRPVAVVTTLLAMVLCATLDRLGAQVVLTKGTRAVALKLSKDQKIPGEILPGTAVDVVAEISEPITTGIAVLNVKVLVIDTTAENQTVTVQVTPVQAEVLALMQKDGTKLRIKLREKEKPKQ
jgi:Flp pilus assembly protein CpaB